jgi:hypothetical protein
MYAKKKEDVFDRFDTSSSSMQLLVVLLTIAQIISSCASSTPSVFVLQSKSASGGFHKVQKESRDVCGWNHHLV